MIRDNAPTCAFCGLQFTASNTRGPTPTYCCAACRQAAYRMRQADSPAELFSGMLNMAAVLSQDVFGPIIAMGDGLKEQMIATGWSPTAAEMIAAQAITAAIAGVSTSLLQHPKEGS